MERHLKRFTSDFSATQTDPHQKMDQSNRITLDFLTQQIDSTLKIHPSFSLRTNRLTSKEGPD